MNVSSHQDRTTAPLIEDDDTLKDRFMIFRIGDEDYGIEIAHIIEIIGMQAITEIPDMPAFVKGVINLRGQVIPVIDIRLRFQMEERAYDDRTCIIVVEIDRISVGIINDTVREVRTIPEEDITPPSPIASGKNSRFIKGLGKIGDEVKILLDVNRLLFDDPPKQAAAD